MDARKIVLKREPFIRFYNTEDESSREIGRFDYRDGKWFFEGDMEESAKLFIEMVINNLPTPPEN